MLARRPARRWRCCCCLPALALAGVAGNMRAMCAWAEGLRAVETRGEEARRRSEEGV